MSATFKSGAALHLENLALRHQLGVLHRSVKRPKLISADRLLWVWLCDVWNDWRSALVIVKPETVIAWHRKGFQLFWTWKVRRGRLGRPAVQKDVRALIRKMSRENLLWGAPRIHGELLKLGIDIGETSVGKYWSAPGNRRRRLGGPSWRITSKTMVSVGFFTVPTTRSRSHTCSWCWRMTGGAFCILVSRTHPTAGWTAQQLREAFPWETASRYLLRDRDGIFGADFVKQVKAMGIKQVLSAPRSQTA